MLHECKSMHFLGTPCPGTEGTQLPSCLAQQRTWVVSFAMLFLLLQLNFTLKMLCAFPFHGWNEIPRNVVLPTATVDMPRVAWGPRADMTERQAQKMLEG